MASKLSQAQGLPCSLVPLAFGTLNSFLPFPERIFEEEDLQLLLQLVRRAAFKWKELGLALGFLKSELDEIEATIAHAAGGPEAYLRELLSRWLDWAPPNHRLPSSRTLAEALRSETGRVAYRLEQYFNVS